MLRYCKLKHATVLVGLGLNQVAYRIPLHKQGTRFDPIERVCRLTPKPFSTNRRPIILVLLKIEH